MNKFGKIGPRGIIKRYKGYNMYVFDINIYKIGQKIITKQFPPCLKTVDGDFPPDFSHLIPKDFGGKSPVGKVR